MAESARQESFELPRVVAAAAAVIACAFLWGICLTYDRYDWPSPLVWPHNEPPVNIGGAAGAWFAYHVRGSLGAGVWPLCALASLAVGAQLLRGTIRDLPLRLIGALLVIAATSAIASLVSADARPSWPGHAGGTLGAAIVALLRPSLSGIGTLLALLAVLVIGSLAAADDIFLGLARHLRRRLARSATPVLTAPADAAAEAIVMPTPPRRPGRSTRRARPSSIPWGWLIGTRQRISEILSRIRSVTSSAAEPAVALAGAGSHADADPLPQGASLFVAAPPAEPAEPVAAPRASTLDGRDDGEEAGWKPVPQSSSCEPPAPVIDPEPASPSPEGTAPLVRTVAPRPAEPRPPVSSWPRERGDYVLPPLELLDEPQYRFGAALEPAVREKAATLETTLQEFRLDARVVEIETGPVVTMYELSLAPGIKVSQIASLSNDIARALRAPGVRVVAPLEGKNTIGIEVPNVDKEKVRLKELIVLSGVKPTRMALPLFLGKDASGNPLIADLASMPHMLIAGTTGSGKSVCINTLVMSILLTQRPDHVKLILVDPKMVELSVFKDVPHLMCPIVTDMRRAETILEWAATKMDERYEQLAEAGVRNVAAFNRLGREEVYRRFNPLNEEEKAQIPTHLPYIVIIIDELADLMMTSGKEVERHLARIAQKSRAVGIHVILATQRPQANVVTGLIKSNLPCRIAFRVSSRMDSRIVLDQNGAEVLMGQGDMLFLPPGSAKLVRAQGTYVEDEELHRVLDDLRRKAEPEFHQELVRLRPAGAESDTERDPLFDQAVDIVIETRRGSVSLLQRRLAIGYTRASRLIDQMACAGIVGDHKGSVQREVLITAEEWAALRGQRDREIAHGNYAADRDDAESNDGNAPSDVS